MLPLPALTVSVLTSCMIVPELRSATDSSDSMLLALARLVTSCVLMPCDCVTSSARAVAIGSSAAVRFLRPVGGCDCVRASADCSELICPTPTS